MEPQYPPVHPRRAVVEEARSELDLFLSDWGARHDLTPSEYLYLLAGQLESYAAGCVRGERRKG
jgi:hypothetical protein